jgi:hypothetical protein
MLGDWVKGTESLFISRRQPLNEKVKGTITGYRVLAALSNLGPAANIGKAD